MLKVTLDLPALIARGNIEMFSIVAPITPAIAEELLKRNKENRPVRWRGAARTVEAYAAAMKRDEWQLNGEAIIVADTGMLNDGQHRLHAVIASGCTVPMQITFGADRDSRHTVDQGAARTPGNILSMFGEKQGNHLAHGLQFIWAYDGRGIFSYRPSPDQMMDTLDVNPLLRDAINDVNRIAKDFRLSRGYCGAAYLICCRANGEQASDFLHDLETGLGITDRNSPIYRLRKRFIDHLSKRDALTALEQAALLIKAFNFYRRGRTIRNLVWRQNGDAPEPFPRVS